LNIEDDIGYKIIYRIKSVFGWVRTLDDVLNIPLIKHENIIADKGGKSCNICMVYKPLIVFFPCCHGCCVSCAFKLDKCHQCRGVIEDRRVVFD
jgi:hypothetical protein